MATPALDWLRRAVPEATIHGLGRRAAAGILRGHPSLDAVIEADERRADPALRDELRAAAYDAVALLTNSAGSAWFAWRLGVPRRVGFARALRGPLLTHPVRFNRAEWRTGAPEPISRRSRLTGAGTPPRHMVHYYLEVIRATVEALGLDGFPYYPGTDTPLTLARDTQADARAAEALAAITGPVIALNPGAAYGGAKRWPLERLATAGRMIAERTGGTLVSTASRFESDLAAELERHLLPTPLVRAGEQLDLPGLTALLRRAAVLVTNDSGAMHVAAATGTPTVALFGPTDWNVTFPWSPAAVVVRESPPCAPCLLRECPIDHRCMTAITPERVADAALDLLARESAG